MARKKKAKATRRGKSKGETKAEPVESIDETSIDETQSADCELDRIEADTIRIGKLITTLTLTLAILLLGYFGQVLLLDRNFSFRDAGHFYHPLLRFVQDEWSKGIVPLWNPYDNCGTPLVAMGTSAVFYPIKLLFFLPTSFDTNLKLFVIVHFLLGWIGTYFCTRKFDCSSMGSAIAATSFVFGGSVIFQYCNLPFLCSACWLPWGVWAGVSLIEKTTIPRITALGMVLSLMVLGGDPQMAYHLGMMLFLLVIVGFIWNKRKHSSTNHDKSESNDSDEGVWSGSKYQFLRSTVMLLLAALLALGLSAIQILPTASYASNSVRKDTILPRSIWEVPSYFLSSKVESFNNEQQIPNWYDALVGNPPLPAKHDAQVYGFSLPPFRILECLLPNVGGRKLPGEKRLWTLLGEEQIWMPTVYFGLLPFVLVIGSLGNWRKSPVRIWLVIAGAIFLLASFGNFAPGYFWTDPENATAPIGSAVGGLYWFFVVFLPGYSMFRFPAKLWIITGFALATLAGISWDDFWSSKRIRRRVRLILITTLVIGLAGIVVVAVGSVQLNHEQSISDVNFGQILQGLLFCFVQVVVVAALLVFTLSSGRLSLSNQFKQIAVLIILALDLVVANSWTVRSTETTQWYENSAAATLVAQPESTKTAAFPKRIFVADIRPDIQKESSISDLNNKLYSMMHVPQRIQKVVNSTSTMRGLWRARHFEFLPFPEYSTVVQPRRTFDLWGTEIFMIGDWSEQNEFPMNMASRYSNLGLKRAWDEQVFDSQNPIISLFPRGEFLSPVKNSQATLAEMSSWEARSNPNALPIARIVHQIEMYPEFPQHKKDVWFPVMMSTVFPLTEFRNLGDCPIVEDKRLAKTKEPELKNIGTARELQETVRLLKYESSEVIVETVLESNGFLVLAETYDPGWKVFISSDGEQETEGEILRTNFAMRGVRLEKGTQRVRFAYLPDNFVLGAWLSGTFWALCVLIGLAGSIIRFVKTDFSSASSENSPT